jgi:hypothetical protein
MVNQKGEANDIQVGLHYHRFQDIDSEAWATVRQIVPTEEKTGPIPGSWSLVQPVALEYLFDSIGI